MHLNNQPPVSTLKAEIVPVEQISALKVVFFHQLSNSGDRPASGSVLDAYNNLKLGCVDAFTKCSEAFSGLSPDIALKFDVSLFLARRFQKRA